jgi:hypothetical protein
VAAETPLETSNYSGRWLMRGIRFHLSTALLCNFAAALFLYGNIVWCRHPNQIDSMAGVISENCYGFPLPVYFEGHAVDNEDGSMIQNEIIKVHCPIGVGINLIVGILFIWGVAVISEKHISRSKNCVPDVATHETVRRNLKVNNFDKSPTPQEGTEKK